MTKTTFRLYLVAAVLLLPLSVPVSCSGDSDTTATTASGASAPAGQGPGGSATGGAGGAGSNSGGAAAGGNTTSGGGFGGFTLAACQGHIYECGDTIDNDMDGLIDWADPDCLGPCDNTEDSFFGGIPGQTGPPCAVDCYFDQDSGAGNDDCYWDHGCDTHEVAPDYYPEPSVGTQCEYDPNTNISGSSSTCAELSMTQSQECLDFCGPLTPNGCDCFGCCEIPDDSGNFVWLGSEGVNGQTVCSLADVNDPTKCHPCDPVPACLNDCGTCELCIGKTTLPPECDPGSGGAGGAGTGGSGGNNQQCPNGVQACGLPSQPPCPGGFYCITGCCYEVPT